MRQVFLTTGIVTLLNGDKIIKATLALAADKETAIEGFRESAKAANPEMMSLRVLDSNAAPEQFIREAAMELGMVQPFAERVTMDAPIMSEADAVDMLR